MTDRYDRAIAFLTRYPEEIFSAWLHPLTNPGGSLFLFATHTGRAITPEGMECGCLTEIKGNRERGFVEAETPELTEAIRADVRIPTTPDDILLADLPVFAEWQRKLDAEFPGRNPE